MEPTAKPTFDLEPLISIVQSRKASKIALQAPAHLLPSAPAVSETIRNRTGASCYVLADTSYAPCCVDEVGASHLPVDLIVHLGHACLTRNARSPVFYAFDQAPCDVTQCAAAIKAHFTDVSSRVLVFLDPSYQHIASTLSAQLSPTFPNFSFGQVDLFVDPAIPMPEPNGKSITILGRTFEIPPENLSQYTLLWIGGEGQTLTHLLMTHAKLPVFSLDPTTMKVRREGETVNKGLMRRLYLVGKAREANVIGILIATLSVAQFTDVMAKLRKMITAAGKKCYTMVVGKLNPAKLANFPEIEIWTVIACTENTLIDSKEYYRPFITPFELAQALSPDETPSDWLGTYTIDFAKLLPTLQAPEKPLVLDAAETSLILPESGGALTKPKDGADYFARRTYQGLVPAIGETEVTKAVKGRKGIAIAYETEGQQPVQQQQQQQEAKHESQAGEGDAKQT